MPPLPPVPGTVKVELIGTFEDTTWANIFHMVDVPAFPSVTLVGDILDKVENEFKLHFLPLLANSLTVTQGIATDLSSLTGPRVEHFYSDSGSIGTSTWAASVAVGISWGIASRYRGGHPRTYLTGIPTATGAASSVKNLSASAITSFETGAAAFLAALTDVVIDTDTVTLGCAHYSGPVELGPYPTSEPIISSTVHKRYDSQRRRLGKEST
jgi:hypothetical protein